MVGRRFPLFDDTGGDLVIIGTGDNADIAYEYLRYDSPFDVVAFSTEEAFIDSGTKFGLKVIPFERLEEFYPPAKYKAFVSVGYKGLNRLRARLFGEALAKGYQLISYVSSEAFVWHDAKIGRNCFILEDNTIQPFVTIGDDTVLWAGNHIGHGVTIGSHVFIASHVVASGFSSIGDYSFVGVNVSIGHNVKIGKGCIVGAGTIVGNTGDNAVFIAERTKACRVDAEKFIKMMEV